jgi:hypothetical protein
MLIEGRHRHIATLILQFTLITFWFPTLFKKKCYFLCIVKNKIFPLSYGTRSTCCSAAVLCSGHKEMPSLQLLTVMCLIRSVPYLMFSIVEFAVVFSDNKNSMHFSLISMSDSFSTICVASWVMTHLHIRHQPSSR